LEASRARLLVITSAGERAFCAGTDLGELKGLTLEERRAKSDASRDLLVRLHRSPLLSVAAINGLAFGGGLELAMACSLRITAAHATMSLPEIKLGLVPAYAGTQLLPTLVGKARALDLMLTGRAIDAREAHAIGLVHRIASAEGPLIDQALAFAREITRWSPGAIRAIRTCVDAAGEHLSDEGLAIEKHEVNANYGSADALEGMAAFLEKRAANFSR
ncbi:MAG: enoyl-CoA hydratase/isomerase family protein, partial [Betaproteobacteria bacterium]